jgi:beta-galactosidase
MTQHSRMDLGVCYYPEHWPEEWWASDARRMVGMGIRQVRIGEFAWSRLEPQPGDLRFDWLERALDTLGAAGLGVVLGTPTATPPKWLVDADPSMLAVGADGRVRGFGSRRHYCFSSQSYRAQCARIVEALGQRFGTHPAVIAWQTDNEYGCHDTVESYSPAARDAFRLWLAERYCGDIGALNAAWGTVFWSMEYRSFDEIELPSGTVTEAAPAHRLDFQRFSSDQVVGFNRPQADILRRLSPGRAIIHNFMGQFTAFDHFHVGADLDVSSWDSYPLGFLEWFPWPAPVKERFLRKGHPDFTAFHHDLYRATSGGRWQVMEQQPGPVNWGAWNPAPLPGMVRAWTWEAFAHGAEVVSYFRWRQAPFAQEQMHAGLLRPDSTEAEAVAEVRQVAAELETLRPLLAGATQAPAKAPVALMVDYQGIWSTQIQPQGRDFRPLEIILAVYAAARRLGLDVDVVAPGADLGGHAILLLPHLPIWPPGLTERIRAAGCAVVAGPRTGSKTSHHAIPDGLPPEGLNQLIDLKVLRVESLRPGHAEPAGPYSVTRWLEHVETDLAPLAHTPQGHGIAWQSGSISYLATWPCPALLDAVLRPLAQAAGLAPLDLPEGLRLRRRGPLRFAVNYGPEPVDLREHVPALPQLVVGTPWLAPAEVTVWIEAEG